jgi:hypothetical protein
VRPTRLPVLVVTAVVCAAIGWVLLRAVYANLPPLPWTAVPALLLAAAAEAWIGRDLRARIAGKRESKPVVPMVVTRMLALAKASAVAAAAIAGLTAGFVIYLAGMLTASTPRQDALTAVITFVSAVVLGCAALYLENSCRVPSDPDGTDEAARPPAG